MKRLKLGRSPAAASAQADLEFWAIVKDLTTPEKLEFIRLMRWQLLMLEDSFGALREAKTSSSTDRVMPSKTNAGQTLFLGAADPDGLCQGLVMTVGRRGRGKPRHFPNVRAALDWCLANRAGLVYWPIPSPALN
jgi:hypothetical protein